MEMLPEKLVKRPSYGFFVYRQINEEIQYLLLEKQPSGAWEPPKGKIEKGENELETAYREVYEESGLSKEHLEVFLDMKTVLQFLTRKGKEKTVVLWLARLKNIHTDVSLSDEHRTYKWLDVEEACDLLLYDNAKNGIRNCERYIRQKEIMNDKSPESKPQ